jgi:hypothetical protein
MTTPYYANFPKAPDDIVEALVNLIPLPGLFESHVGTDNSLFLDVVFDQEHPFTLQKLTEIAAFCGTPEEYVYVEASEFVEGALSITMAATLFDFTEQFDGTPFENSPYLGVGILDEEPLPTPVTTDDAIDSIDAALKKFVSQLIGMDDEEEDEEEDPDSEEEDDGFQCAGPYGCKLDSDACTGVHQPGEARALPPLSPEAAQALYDGIPTATPAELAGVVYIDVTDMNVEDVMALMDVISTAGGL